MSGLLLRAAVALVLLSGGAAAQGYCPNTSIGAADILTTSPYTIGGADMCRTKIVNDASAFTMNLQKPPPPNFNATVMNIGAGTATLTPPSGVTINGLSSMALTKGQSAILSTGTDGNWYAATNSGSTGGVLGVANGGTGLASGTSGGVLGFTATGTLASSAALAANGVVIGGGVGATPGATAAGTAGQFLVGSAGAPSFLTPASALTKPTGPAAVTPGTSTAQMLGMGTGTGAATLTPAATGRIFYDFTFTALVASTTNGATFQCSHGTGAAPANAGAPAGTQDSAAVAYLAGATTEKAVIHCAGALTGLTLGTAVWFDVAVLNTTGSQAVTVTVPTFNGFEF
jgi:hypothetical protein